MTWVRGRGQGGEGKLSQSRRVANEARKEKRLDSTNLRKERNAFESLGEEDVNDSIHGLGVVKSAESWIRDDSDERVEDDGLEVILVRLPSDGVHQQTDIGLSGSDMLVRTLVDLLEENLK